MNYDDNNPEHRKAVDEWLTRPRKNLDKVVYDPAIEEKKTHHNLDIDNLGKPKKKPVDIQKRILDASALYDGYVPDGAKVPEALKPDPKRLMSDKTEQYLRKQLIEKMNKGPLDSEEVRFLMDTKPKQPEATPQQMAELKKKLDKYRYIHHGEDKPMKKPFKKKSAVLNIPSTPIVREPIQPPLPKPKEPEEPLEDMIKRLADERLKREQQEWDRMFGTRGIAQLKRPT